MWIWKRHGVVASVSSYTPGANADAVAEHTLALLLALAKRLRFWHDALVRGDYHLRWTERSVQLQGKTLGIIGFGHVGRAVARRAPSPRDAVARL
jgi:phosphoglycerate dehydrogenase-like enzyme